MGFPLLPFIGQDVTVRSGSQSDHGVLAGLTESQCTIRRPDGTSQDYPLSAIERGEFKFLSYQDAFKHLADSGQARHCQSCYIAMLYAVDLLALTFRAQPFVARADLIKRGIISFLGGDYPTATYALFPQVDGITTQILHEDGLLRQTDGFPVWTKEHPDYSFHGKQCRNLIDALEGARSAGNSSRVSHMLSWFSAQTIEDLRGLRNKLLHGTLLDVSEHEAATVILVLQALHHGVAQGVSVKVQR